MSELNSQTLKEFVEKNIADTDCFVTEVKISPNGDILVEIDSDTRVDIDYVADLSRKIEEEFAPAIDDFNLEVGSAGLTSPLRMPRQFAKNIGNDVEVLGCDGKKYHGTLTAADDNGFTIETEEKVRHEGAKKPVKEIVSRTFGYADAKSVVYDLKF